MGNVPKTSGHLQCQDLSPSGWGPASQLRATCISTAHIADARNTSVEGMREWSSRFAERNGHPSQVDLFGPFTNETVIGFTGELHDSFTAPNIHMYFSRLDFLGGGGHNFANGFLSIFIVIFVLRQLLPFADFQSLREIHPVI